MRRDKILFTDETIYRSANPVRRIYLPRVKKFKNFLSLPRASSPC